MRISPKTEVPRIGVEKFANLILNRSFFMNGEPHLTTDNACMLPKPRLLHFSADEQRLSNRGNYLVFGLLKYRQVDLAIIVRINKRILFDRIGKCFSLDLYVK